MLTENILSVKHTAERIGSTSTQMNLIHISLVKKVAEIIRTGEAIIGKFSRLIVLGMLKSKNNSYPLQICCISQVKLAWITLLTCIQYC